MAPLRSWFLRVGIIAALLSVSAVTASADPLTLEGSTSGNFYMGSTSLGSSIDLLGLSFTGSDFGPTSVNEGSTALLDLGIFGLSSLVAVFNPFDFILTVNFTAPVGTNSATFSADLRGAVLPVLGGFAKIDFVNNAPTHFQFSNSEGFGSFDLALADVTLTNGTSKSLFGTISNATFVAVPEPASALLTLLGGVTVLLGRRLRSY